MIKDKEVIEYDFVFQLKGKKVIVVTLKVSTVYQQC